MSISEHIKKYHEILPDSVILVAVSKTKPVSDLQEAYDAGQRDFGENKIQEMTEKQEQLPQDIKWHMIGHVQTNKVKYMAPYVSLIHAVDRLKLVKEINRQAENNNRTINILLQVKIAQEETKFGMPLDQAENFLQNNTIANYPNVRLKGLMGMASFTENKEQIAEEFRSIKKLYDRFYTKYEFDTLSTGMSGDYSIAIKHGSTMVRIGSAIFGSR
ncbi:YggS family pyridoxal phosphate-dependent enzyme [Gangjinia marincola]|uniref:Pyridoxal phosphate homeostasis protein n=1 Tax=Gangjinia marincola TaxID=578463 RepID=A0ABN1MEV4_9FLAO